MENRTCKIGNSGVIPKVRMCWRSPFVRTSRISPAGCLTISYHKKMGNRVRNQNRVRYLKPRPNHGTASGSKRTINQLPSRSSSSHCHSKHHQPSVILLPSSYSRSPSQEPRYRKKNLLSKALPFPICIRRTVEYSTSGIL